MSPDKFSELILWPREDQVECIGFDRMLLGYLNDALYYLRSARFLDSVPGLDDPMPRAQFDYLGFRYELEGVWVAGRFKVLSIEKIAKIESPEDLEGYQYMRDLGGVEAMMKGNVVVEDYRTQRQKDLHPDFGTW
jgi:hypothetical protein